jgi:hypothetical protein
MTQGYDGLPPYYVQSSNPQTPNLGLTLIGVDPIVADNFVLIDAFAAGGGGTTVKVNGSTVSTPNFNGTIPAAPGGNTNITFQVSGSSVSAYVPTSSTTWSSLTGTLSNGQVIPYADAGFSRIAANNLGAGNSGAGDVSARFQAAILTINSAAPTATAVSRFELHSSSSSKSLITMFSHDNGGGSGGGVPGITTFVDNGTQLAPSPVVTGQAFGKLSGGGYDGTSGGGFGNGYFESMEMIGVADENWSSIAHGARIDFYTVPVGSVALINYLTFTNSGNLRFNFNSSVLQWNSSAVLNAGISWIGNASLAIGNGTTGDFSGTLKATILNAVTGFQVNGAAASGNVLRGNGTNFVSAQLAFSDLSGNITTSQMNSGTSASTATFWRGDGTWSSVLGTNASVAGTLGIANGGGSGTTITIQNLGNTTPYNFNLPATPGTAGQLLTSQGGGSSSMTWTTVSGSGTVTSVAMTGDGVIFNSTVGGSPVTTSGTLVPALLTQTANTVLCGPTSGGAAAPTFRALVAADIPSGAPVAWSSLTNALGALTLANAGNATTFNQTSAVNWTWANTTSATVTTPQNAPAFIWSGQYWATGAATGADTWTLAQTLTAGLNGASILALSHSGTTGTTALRLPSASVLQWSTDTGLSRSAGGQIAVGTGAANSQAGFMLMAGATFGTTVDIGFNRAGISLGGSGSQSVMWTTSGASSGTVDASISRATTNTLQIGTTSGAGNNSGNLQLNTITSYGGTSTVAQGVPSEIAISDLTAQTAAIAATSLTASAPRTGRYRVSFSATITTASDISSVLGGTNGFQVIYTSPTDSVAKTTVSGNSITSAANTTSTAIADTLMIYAKTGTAIQFKFDYTDSHTSTAMAYEIHTTLEAL